MIEKPDASADFGPPRPVDGNLRAGAVGVSGLPGVDDERLAVDAISHTAD